MKLSYPPTSSIASDLVSANPVNYELCASLASRGLSLSLADKEELQSSGGAPENVDGIDLEDGICGGDEPGDVIIHEGLPVAGRPKKIGRLKKMLMSMKIIQ